MRISQLAASTGIPISTIRYYDYQHLIPESYMHKLPNGQRDFTAAAIPFLTKIHTIIHAGVQINELKTLLIERPTPAVINQQVAVVRHRIAEIEKTQAELESYKQTLLSLLNDK